MSSTGSGDLEELVLRIFLDSGQYLDIPARRGEPDIVGFRFQSHGRYPDEILDFERHHIPSGIDISGKEARIRLKIVGQGWREYKVRMAE